MGYTHYWRRPQEFPAEPFAAWTVDVRTILANLPEHTATAGGYHEADPLLVGGWEGAGAEPETDDNSVAFNGYGGAAEGDGSYTELSHESFVVERIYQPYEGQKPGEHGRWFTFCKTARKPYDLAVTAALIRLVYHFPEGVEVSSDGDAADWQEGLALCKRLFGFAMLPPEVERREADAA